MYQKQFGGFFYDTHFHLLSFFFTHYCAVVSSGLNGYIKSLLAYRLPKECVASA